MIQFSALLPISALFLINAHPLSAVFLTSAPIAISALIPINTSIAKVRFKTLTQNRLLR